MAKKSSVLYTMLCACALIFTMTACGKQTTDAPAVETAPVTEVNEAALQSETPETSEPAPETPKDTLVVGYDLLPQKFIPLFEETEDDFEVVYLTQIALLETDFNEKTIMNGSRGEKIAYNGKDYTYTTTSDLEIVQNADGTVDYNITLRDDLKFSDGEPVTIDDVIFTLYVLSDPTYEGIFSFNNMPVTGLNEYRFSKKEGIDSISGIKKTGDYTCTITADYYEETNVYKLGVIIIPLHYYGDKSQYDYDNNKFGFNKGDLSIIESKTIPMGAGPYKFISHENGTVSFEANDLYYRGAPKTKYLSLQEVPESDKISSVIDGALDIASTSLLKEDIASIKEANSNGELTGDVLTSFTTDDQGYASIGINANNVSVGNKPDSGESKALRSAFATLYAAYRKASISPYFGSYASVIEYPTSNALWDADSGDRIAYSIDSDGLDIYSDDMGEADKEAAALKAAIGFLKKAGYKWEEAGSKFISAPTGALMDYEVLIYTDDLQNHPVYGILTAAKEALATIGITLEIKNLTDYADFWNALYKDGTAQMWFAANHTSPFLDAQLNYSYHSSNILGRGGVDSNICAIADKRMDELIEKTLESDDEAFRNAAFKDCFNIALDWAVEVPIYQRQNVTIVSTKRVNADTLNEKMPKFYKWWFEVENIEVR